MKLHHHFLPHKHAGASVHHRAHAISISALFIYIQLLIVVSAGTYIIRLTKPAILGTATFSAQQIIDITNQKRQALDLPPLVYNPRLEAAAQKKAANMFLENYWAHYAPSGKTPWSFITAEGYKYTYAGENLARDFTSAPDIVNAWMNSPSHRENIVDKNFKEIGVAVQSGTLTGKDGILVVQMFGASSSQASVDSSQKEQNQNSTATVNREPITVNQTATVLASRQFGINRTVSLALIGFIFMLFVFEALYLAKQARAHLGNGILAHIVILGFLLLALWYSVSGAII